MSEPVSEGPRHSIVVVDPQETGIRLDQFITNRLGEFSRSRVKGMVEEGQVTVDGRTITNPSMRVKPGQTLGIAIPAPIDDRPVPQALPLSVLFEDEHLIVVDKPPGMVVHPAPGNPDRTLVNALLAHCGASLQGIGGVRRPGIVHRLDKDTSGVMVAAKTEQAHAALAAAFAGRTIERAYTAVVWGMPVSREATIDLPIGRSTSNRQKMAVNTRGRPAITHYRVVRPLGRLCAIVECRLGTGRTHQIRVHLTELGHPLVGDPVYGKVPVTARLSAKRPEEAGEVLPLIHFGRQALHAYRLGFLHPASGLHMRFETPVPQDLATLIADLE